MSGRNIVVYSYWQHRCFETSLTYIFPKEWSRMIDGSWTSLVLVYYTYSNFVRDTHSPRRGPKQKKMTMKREPRKRKRSICLSMVAFLWVKNLKSYIHLSSAFKVSSRPFFILSPPPLSILTFYWVEFRKFFARRIMPSRRNVIALRVGWISRDKRDPYHRHQKPISISSGSTATDTGVPI